MEYQAGNRKKYFERFRVARATKLFGIEVAFAPDIAPANPNLVCAARVRHLNSRFWPRDGPAGCLVGKKYSKADFSESLAMSRASMAYLMFAVGFAAFVLEATHITWAVQARQVAATASDIEYRWARSSGPNGERDPAGLPLYEAIFAGDKDKVAVLLDHGASPNRLLYPGQWSPLMLAIQYNDHDTVRMLVKHGADINYISNDPVAGTPLAEALDTGRFYTVEHPNDYLADHIFSDTGFDASTYHPDFSIFYYLLDSGADMNVEFRRDDIATYAAGMGQMAVVNDLLARGYRHDLRELKRSLEIRIVPEKIQVEKDKALSTINRLLKP